MASNEPGNETANKSSGPKAKGKGPAVEIHNENEAKIDDSQRDGTSPDALSNPLNKKSHRESTPTFCGSDTAQSTAALPEMTR